MNVKRKLITPVLLSTLIGAGAGVASAADHSELVRLGYLGTQVQSRPDTTIKVGTTTESVFVDHFATVKFENTKGQSFVWRFDSAMQMSVFPLKMIAPNSFDAGNAQVSVIHLASAFAQ